MKRRYVHGIELMECRCGAWRVAAYELPCWKHEDRKQLMVEAQAQLAQSIRNLGYQIAKAVRLV